MNSNLNRQVLTAFLLFVFLQVNAQRKGEKVQKQIEAAANAVEKLDGIFGKKNKDTTSRKGTSPGTRTSGVIADKHPSGINFSGKMAANVKLIDCDDMDPFNMGAACIRKGNACALIDASGNFIVPFNKYKTIFAIAENYTGIFRIMDDKLNCFMNSTGKILFEFKGNDGYTTELSDDSRHIVHYKKNPAGTSTSLVIIDYFGNRTALTIPGLIKDAGVRRMFGVRDSVIVYSAKVGGKTLYGFKNIWDKGILPAYDDIEPFHDGVAIFTKVDEFGKVKHGVIDKHGKIILPAQFTDKPPNFSYGFANVRANASADFLAAFFDTKGNVLYKLTREDQKIYGYFGAFITDYAISSSGYLLHKSGKIIKKEDLFKEIGFDSNTYKSPVLIPALQPYDDRLLRFEFRDKGLLKRYYGTYNLDTRAVAYYNTPEIQNIKYNQFHLDPVSKLTYASLLVDEKDKNGKPMRRVGYVNLDGEFVIVKGGEKSDW